MTPSSPAPARLLLTGATGNVGAAALRALLPQRPADATVVVAARDPDRARHQLQLPTAVAGVEFVPFDFERPDTVAPALAGVTRLLLVRPPELGDVRRYLRPVVEAARAAGVRHAVFLSLQGAQYNPLAPHRKVERYLKRSGLTYTFLRPSFFMQNLATTHRDDIRRGELVLPTGQGRTAFVDAADVGCVAAQALLDPYVQSAAYELTSAEPALTYAEVAATLAEVLGRPVCYHAASVKEFRQHELAKGTPKEFVNVMTGIYLAARLGLAAHVSPTLKQLLGREPTTLREFAEREKNVWA